jgi:iron complex outermembrane receptor protein
VTVTAVAALMVQFAGVAPAFAQQAVETVEITGSRIKNVDAESANPVTVVGAAEIAQSGAINVEQALQQIGVVDFNGGFSAADNNSGLGASIMGLHSLGPTRTLILVNGQRFVSTDFQQPFTAVDLNNIPAAMIDHIEVLRDGASSVYGADAIGGVVNIITKSHVEGMTADAEAGVTGKGDGQTYSAWTTAGANVDRGNIFIAAGYDKQDPIYQRNRDWASNTYLGTSVQTQSVVSSRLPIFLGSIGGTTPYYAFFNNGQTMINRSDPSLAALVPSTVYDAGRTRFDLANGTDLLGESDRRSVNVTGSYDIKDNITAVFEGFYTDRHSQQQLNGDPIDSTTYTQLFPGPVVPAVLAYGSTLANGTTLAPGSVNPYNPFGKDIYGIWRFQAGGPRKYEDEVQTLHTRFGLTGTVFKDYNWEVGYVYGSSDATYKVANSLNFQHFMQETGQLGCSAGDAANGCSLGNFLNGLNTLTPAQIRYLGYTDTRTSTLEEDFVYANIGGPIVNLPAGPLKGLFGFERRNESETDNPDSLRVAGDADYNAYPTNGQYDVYSLYTEYNIPVLKDLPGAKALTLNLSGRFDHYSNFGDAGTWKTGFDYAIVQDLRFRGSASTGFRAPDVKELYGGAQSGAYGYSGDPCDSANGLASNAANCAIGLAKSGFKGTFQDNTSGQITGLSSGNPNLKPEKSQALSFGTVVTPRWVPNLSVATDWWNVFIRNSIVDNGFLGQNADAYIAECYGPGAAAYASNPTCQAIQRSAQTGNIQTVNTPNANFGFEKTSGIDIDVDYSIKAQDMYLPLDGKFNFGVLANYLIRDTVSLFGGTIQKNAGTFVAGGSSGEQKLKGIINVDYSQDDWRVHYDARYLGPLHDVAGATKNFGDYAPQVWYHDISGTYTLKDLEGVKNVDITFGIRNLFDKDPPVIIPNSASTNSLTDAGYDYVGRFFYMRLSTKF